MPALASATASRLGAVRAGGILLAYFAAQVVVGGAIGAAAGISFALGARELGSVGLEAVVAMAAPLGATFGVAVGGLLVASLARRAAGELARDPGPLGVGFGWGPASGLGRGAALGAGLGIAYMGFVLILGAPESASLGPTARLVAVPGPSRWLWTLLAVALAPPAEEYLFRGVLLAGLTRSWNRAAAGVAVCLLFTAVHLPETVHYPPAILATGLLGVVALGLRWSSGRLGPAVAAHAAYNAVLAAAVHAG